MLTKKILKPVSYAFESHSISTFGALLCNPQPRIIEGEAESSLWFTTLPHKRKNALLMKEKKRKPVPKFIPKGPPIISCKNENFNHFSGQKYDKFDSVPIATKGWYHYKSKGDYFSILPTTDHPAFLMTKSDLDTAAGTFEEAGIDSWLNEVLRKSDMIKPTTIQAKAIPSILNGRNTLLVSETGCGKTYAYLLPMVQRIAKWKKMMEFERPLNSPLGLVIVPNRELAFQVGSVARELCERTDIKCQTILGGHTKKMLLHPVLEQVDIVVATLGVMSKLTTFSQYTVHNCKHLVLDEADTLLDDSFNTRLLHFLRRFPIQHSGPEDQLELPRGTQMTLVSATMPTSLDDLIGQILSMDSLEKISTKYLHRVLPHVPQTFMRVGKNEKPAVLLRLLRKDSKVPTMIFSNSTSACNFVAHFLNDNGVPCERINSRIGVDDRMGKYERFKQGEVNAISCTDLTSRGINSTQVKHVINFDFPLYMADYIHRCGRTGRLGYDKNCQITSLVSSRREIDLLQQVEIAARTFQELHNVNNNIPRIINHKNLKNNPEKDESEKGKDEVVESEM